MTKIFLVTSGQYSDYSVDAVFSTHEKAMSYVGEDLEKSGCNIEEFEIDGNSGETHKDGFMVIIDLESGDITESHPSGKRLTGLNSKYESAAISDMRDFGKKGTGALLGRITATVYSYVDQDHAIK